MTFAVRRGEARYHRQSGWHCGDPQMAGQALAQAADLVAHGAGVGDDAAGPFENALALGCQADKARAPVDQQDAEALLELFDACGQGRLRHAAHFSRMAKMPLMRECD